MILIILPVKNEHESLAKTVEDLDIFCRKNFEEAYAMLVIDDGSEPPLKPLKFDRMGILRNVFDPGKGSALKTGFVLSEYLYKLEDDDLVIFMDGDGQIHPKNIKTLLNLMELYDAEVVIGNKRHPYSLTKYTLKRKIVSRAYNLMLRVLFGINYNDTQAGIKIFKKEALSKVIDRVTCKNYAFDIEMIVALREQNIRVADAPISIKEQMNSGSVTMNNCVSTFLNTLSVWKKYRKGFYSKEIQNRIIRNPQPKGL